MSYLVLARKYRPQSFDEIIGQEHISRSLKNAILSKRIAHSYLFAGPRGVGKTSAARILAKALNCVKGPTPHPCQKCTLCQEITQGINIDVLEIDGASNRRIDEIRNLRENVKFAPIRARFKIYIIDEVHMLTVEAFNALLKTLEEPPAHIKFIFATTQPEKIPLTILSRCQKFDFRRIASKQISVQLDKIRQEEKINITPGALFAVARFAQGSMRDAESILDQLISFCGKEINEKEINQLLGTVGQKTLFDFGQTILEKDTQKGLMLVNNLLEEGKDLEQFVKEVIEYFRNLIMAREGMDNLIELPSEEKKRLIEQSGNFNLSELFYGFSLFMRTQQAMRGFLDKRICFEFFFLKMLNRESFVSIEEILEKIKMPQTVSDDVQNDKKQPFSQREEKDCPLGELKMVWNECLDAVQKERMSLATFLQEGELISVEGDNIKIEFPTEFSFYCQNLARKENENIIKKVVSQKLGREIKIIFSLKEECLVKNNLNVGNEILPSSVKKAMEIFEGRIVEEK